MRTGLVQAAVGLYRRRLLHALGFGDRHVRGARRQNQADLLLHLERGHQTDAAVRQQNHALVVVDLVAIVESEVNRIADERGPIGIDAAAAARNVSVVSQKRLELFSLIFAHPRLSAAGLDRLQRLFAAV